MHLCNTKIDIILILPGLSDFEFVNAQHNDVLYMNWCLLKGHFSQQMTNAEENSIVEPGVLIDGNINR